MASPNQTDDAISRLGVREEERPVWTSAFNDEARLSQLNDDLLAGKSVSGVLVFIVSVGLALAIGSVLICIQ